MEYKSLCINVYHIAAIKSLIKYKLKKYKIKVICIDARFISGKKVNITAHIDRKSCSLLSIIICQIACRMTVSKFCHKKIIHNVFKINIIWST